jgi:predicted CXXCH cytochrome family protein
MFKKLLFACVVLVLAVGTVPALAGISGTSHELPLTATGGGACATCHLPHGAVQGARLWVKMPVGTIPNTAGSVGMLCAYCHLFNQSGATGPNVEQDAPSSTWVYNANSHGLKMGKGGAVNLPRSYNAIPNTSSGFPYIDAGTDQLFECTTCHDVHNDGVPSNANGHRPFLRASINVLCTGCHDNRMYISGTAKNDLAGTGGQWGLSNVGLGNPGSHPVGNDITGNFSGGNSPIQVYRHMKIPYNTSANQWAIGGHLTNGAGDGGVTCVTCHAVHGVRGDYHFAASGVATSESHQPYVNFLNVQQSSYTPDADGRSVASGGNATASLQHDRLCEACHVGAAIDAGYAAGTLTSFYNPNPGGTPYTHPVDNMNAVYYTWVNAFPAQWPIGYYTGKSSPNVICESCHVAHPAANTDTAGSPGTVRADLSGVTHSDYILRGTAADVCQKCHTAALSLRHHPTGVTYQRNNVVYLNQGASGADTLECGTCHSGAGAHNWVGGRSNAGLNANWKPYNNGRYATATSDRYNFKMSITCMDCHYGLSGTDLQNPSDGGALNTNYSGSTNETTTTYANLGRGTHALGRLGQGGAVGIRISKTSKAAYWGCFGAVMSNPETATWTAAFGGNGGWSRFGADGVGLNTNVTLVCESCHELQLAKNTNTHLLLGRYTEQVSTALSNRSRFCEACHLPPGTHQMTGDLVKTGGDHTLNTSLNTSTRPWMQAPTDANVILNQTANIINCDSCHQVHQANTGSRTFIIDVSAGSYGLTGSFSSYPATFGSYTSVGGVAYFPSTWSGKGPTYTAFCQQCHPY